MTTEMLQKPNARKRREVRIILAATRIAKNLLFQTWHGSMVSLKFEKSSSLKAISRDLSCVCNMF